MRLLFWSALFLIALWRIFSPQSSYPEGQKVRVKGVIISEPTRIYSFQNLKIAGLSITLPAYPQISYGDNVVIEGTVSGGVLKDAVLTDLKESNVFLVDLRKSLISFYQKTLPEPHASLLSGIVLGAKGNYPPDFWNSLKNSGVTHVIVASGMNVSIAAVFFMSLAFLFLPRKKALPAALAGIWLYVLLSGIQAPVVRAALMSSFVFTFQAKGRLVSGATVLFISALIMLIIVPSWIGDIGFILSFVATASLTLFENKVRRLLSFMPNILQFREGLSTTLAAQLGVTPILFVTFGQFNVFSPIINALVLWTVPYIMIIGIVGGAVGLILPILGQGIVYLTYPLTWWFVTIVSTFG
jgi:competence protein ComEC